MTTEAQKLKELFDEFKSKVIEIVGHEITVNANIHGLPSSFFSDNAENHKRIEEDDLVRYKSERIGFYELSIFSVHTKQKLSIV